MNLDTPEDRYLVRQMQDANSELAFTQLYEKYSHAVYVLCFQYLESPALAEDALQEIFLKIWTKRHVKNNETPFRHFLFTVAKNQLLDMLKRQHKYDCIDKYEDTLGEEDGTEMKIMQESQLRDIQRAITLLSPQKQRVVQMKFHDHHTNQEIADQLNISVNTVKSLYFQALRELRDKVGILL